MSMACTSNGVGRVPFSRCAASGTSSASDTPPRPRRFLMRNRCAETHVTKTCIGCIVPRQKPPSVRLVVFRQTRQYRNNGGGWFMDTPIPGLGES